MPPLRTDGFRPPHWPASGFPVRRGNSFVPSQIAGLALDLDADLGVTDAGGGAVSAWNDQSGNGRNFAQGTGGNRPTLVSSVINGHSVVRFGADKFMTCTGWNPGNSWSLYAVVRYATNGADYQLLTRATGTQPPIAYLGGNSGGTGTYNRPMAYASATLFASWGSTLSAATNYLVRYTFEVTTDIVTVSVNNGAAVSMDGTGVGVQDMGVGTITELGLSVLVQDLLSDLTRVLIYGSVLSGADNTLVTNYLNSRYAL